MYLAAALLLILAIPLTGPSGSFGQSAVNSNGPVAVVNGEPIARSELDAMLRALPPAQEPSLASLDRNALRKEALELLIDDLLLRQFLRVQAPPVAPAECAMELAALEKGLKAKNMTFAAFLQESGQTQDQLKADVQKKLQWERFVKSKATEETLKTYHEKNREFFDRVTVRASHIVFRLPRSAPEHERAAARARLRELRDKIERGEMDFADAARKYSQCQSAAKGGDIGFFPRKWAVDEAIAHAAFALPIGRVSDAVQTDFGFHLIVVTERRPGKPSQFEKIKHDVRQAFTAELMESIVAEQRKKAKIDWNPP
jgi:peptidyl-prolyl cis-trans isomerase C